MNIRNMAKIIYANSPTGFERLPTDLVQEIRKLGVKEYISHLINQYPDMFAQNFLVSNRELWSLFQLNDWKAILIDLQNNPVALLTIISFLNKYQIIDSLSVYKSLAGLNENVKSKVLDVFFERPGLLKLHKFEFKNLLANNVTWVDIEPEDDDLIILED